ncbi:hypothetical protein PHOSAC3_120103 [Mesotoga infera]|nr:hypothetical protein PHOSAC3_120103 [Mesotoga infera]
MIGDPVQRLLTDPQTEPFWGRLYRMTMSDVYAILFVGANGCSPVIGFQGRLKG